MSRMRSRSRSRDLGPMAEEVGVEVLSLQNMPMHGRSVDLDGTAVSDVDERVMVVGPQALQG